MTVFALFPLFFTFACEFCVRRNASLITLIIASLCYEVYFVHVYLDAFFINVDAQSGLVLLCLPFFALVVMVPLWIIAFIQEEQIGKYENIDLEKQDEDLPPLKPYHTLDRL